MVCTLSVLLPVIGCGARGELFAIYEGTEDGGDSGSSGDGAKPQDGGKKPPDDADAGSDDGDGGVCDAGLDDGDAGSDGCLPPGPLTCGRRLRLVVLGDYGLAGPNVERVATMVDRLEPDAVITTGDNNYPNGEAATIDANVGQYFSEFICPYFGVYGDGGSQNRFFPTLGNHDWYTPGAEPYLDYFTLPGNERYYDVVLGSVHFFAIDSDPSEPDGVTPDSEQARWLERTLANSTAPFQIVAMHHPPFSSGRHGSATYMQWPYGAWGVDLVLAGHDHLYERLDVSGVTYVVTGLGGAATYAFGEPLPESQARYNNTHGVTLIEATQQELTLRFIDVDGLVVDDMVIKRP